MVGVLAVHYKEQLFAASHLCSLTSHCSQGCRCGGPARWKWACGVRKHARLDTLGASHLAVGGLPVRSYPGRVKVSLSKTPNP